MKKCSKCKELKKFNEFQKDERYADNYFCWCKECKYKHSINNARTHKGLIKKIYFKQIEGAKLRNQPIPNYTLSEFNYWFISQPNLKKIYNNWVKNEYKKDLRPSVDRLNNYKSYTFDNLQLVTWKENRTNGDEDRKNGKLITSNMRPVLQYDKKKNCINIFYSTMQAQRETNINSSSIVKCCKNKAKSAGGYIWKYKI